MKKIFFCLVAATLALTGCVSTKTYKVALEESAGRKTQLDQTQKDLDNSRQENAKLKKDMEDSKAALGREISSLKSQLQELSSKGIMTSREIEALKQERESLLASDKSKAQEISALKQESDYLKRENERLQVKTGELSKEKEKELANVKSTYENLVKEMQKEIEQGDIKITQAVDRLSVNLVEKILFDSGKAEIKPAGLKILKRVGDILKGISDKQIRVEGHTDNVQIGARIRHKFPTNWELSTARASNVVRYLQDKVGVDPKMLSAAGFSEYKPVASNDTDEGKAQNRRIEIVLLPLDVDRVLEELKK